MQAAESEVQSLRLLFLCLSATMPKPSSEGMSAVSRHAANALRTRRPCQDSQAQEALGSARLRRSFSCLQSQVYKHGILLQKGSVQCGGRQNRPCVYDEMIKTSTSGNSSVCNLQTLHTCFQSNTERAVGLVETPRGPSTFTAKS